MNRLASLLSITVVLGLGFVACDDDDEVPRGDAGADTGAAAMCQGSVFGAYNRTQLGMRASATGQCTSAADLDVVCNNDVGAVSRGCGTSCFLQMGSSASNEALGTCTNNCVKNMINPDPSEGCLGCYAQALACTTRSCLAQCGMDATTTACLTCQTMAGCLTAFFGCSGLPAPTSGAGGAGGSPGNDGGPRDTGAGGAGGSSGSADAARG